VVDIVTAYADFLASKAQWDGASGFEPNDIPDFLFPFQRHLVDFALRMGRGAVFADCGLGKTPAQLVWAENVRRHTGKPVLIVTPLAVSFQTVREAEKFDIEAATSRDGTVTAGITVTNYERLEAFNPDDFGGIVADESSAIKAYDGQRRAIVTEFMRTMPHRLLCTATAAPNDYVELGTSSEALGYLGHQDMLGRFFTNKERSAKAIGGRWRASGAQQWRLKGHAEEAFWRWVTSWARAVRKPSDLGFDDTGFDLPPLVTREHVVKASLPQEGTLFDVPAVGLREERDEARRTIRERCEKVAELTAAHDISTIWCHLNNEGDMLEKLIPNSVQVSGSDSSEYKEDAARWFTGNLCICDDPKFKDRISAWHGNLNTRQPGEPSTTQIQQNGSGARRKDGLRTPIGSTCGSTTPQMETGSGSTGEPTPQSETPGDVIGTQPTRRLEKHTRHPSSNGNGPTRTSDSPNDSEGSESPPQNTKTYSTSRAVDARYVGESQGRPELADTTLTTATKRAPFGGSSAPSVTSAWGNSEMIQHALKSPHCICGHATGIRRLISKPRIFGWGLNFQHCSHVVYFASHSFEAYYQAVRRCWRFGQTSPVTVDLVTTDGGVNILVNLQRKATQADRMFDSLVSHMRDTLSIQRGDTYDQEVQVPSWVTS